MQTAPCNADVFPHFQPVPPGSPEEAATLTELSGSVTVTRSGSTFIASPGEVLWEGDEVRTGSGSSATITLRDGTSRVVMEGNSAFQLSDAGPFGDFDAWNFLDQLFGRIVYDLQSTAPGRQASQIRTPNFSGGLRGTEFCIEYSEPGGVQTTTITVTSGTVEAADLSGGILRSITPVPAGSSLTIASPPEGDAWQPGDYSIPSTLSGGESAEVTVAANNTGSATWSETYALRSVEGPTDTVRLIDRWGITEVPLPAGTAVSPGGQYEFGSDGDLEIAAPPWITLNYLPSVTPTEPPAVSSFACDWMMSHGGGAFGPGIAAGSITIQRPAFSDVPTDYWGWAEVQECANTATASSNFIVQGYGGGSYQPTWDVTRSQMAVFIARAAGYTDELPDPPAQHPAYLSFPDVPTTYWAYPEIERCVLNGVVKGYADYFGEGVDAYLPGKVVTRDQMAVYVQRAAGFPTDVVAEAPFLDVPADYWAAPEIVACVDNNVVKGYPDGLYRPAKNVTRDQMAVFVWRGLVMNGGDVVIAGPAATAFAEIAPSGAGEAAKFLPDAGLSYYGWTSTGVGPEAVIYIGLDGMRVGDGAIDFEVSHVELDEEENEVTVVDDTASVDVTQSEARAAVENSNGIPYLIASYQIPSAGDLGNDGLPEDYTLTITLPNGGSYATEFTIE